MIKIVNVNKTYTTKSGNVYALKNVNIELKPNSLTFVLGKSGSGKTTLLNILAGLDSPSEGCVCHEDVEITTTNDEELDKYRNLDLGIVFQEYNLLESLNVYDNIAIALDIQSQNNSSSEKERVTQVLEYVGLTGLEKRKVSELSGGQAQRVAIARALVKNPKVIFADEPTGNLDKKTGIQIIELMKKISQNCTVVIITHDEEIAKKYGDTILRIEDGCISSVEEIQDSEQKYNLYITNEDKPSFTGLNKDALLSEISNAVQNSTKLDLTIETVHEDKAIIKDRVVNDGENECKSAKPLSMKNVFKFAGVNIGRKPVRTFFVVLLFSLSLFMLMITMYVSRYNYKTVIAEYIKKYAIYELYLYQTAEYKNALYENKETTLTSGDVFLQKLTAVDYGFSYGISNKLALEFTEGINEEAIYEMGNTINYICDEDYLIDKGDLKEGKIASNAAEVVITDYLASILFKGEQNCVGKEICISGVNVKITGILKTDYIEYNFKFKNTYYKNEYTDYRFHRNYGVVVLHKDFTELLKSEIKFIELEYANFLMPDKDVNFNEYPPAIICGVDDLCQDGYDLIVGRLPKNEGEIIVSDYFYQRFIDPNFKWYNAETDSMEYATDSFKEMECSYVNIHDEKYNGYYSEKICMYEWLHNVKIVGVYSPLNEEGLIDTDYAVDQAMFEKIKEKYCESGVFSEYGINIEGMDVMELVNQIENSGLKINEPSINKIYAYKSMLDSLKPILQIILGVVMGITILVLFSYINFSISFNGRQIGILRGIGVSKKDTIKIFIVETSIITTVSLALSLVFDWLIMEYVNDLYKKEMIEQLFNIIVPNWYMCLFIPVVTVLIALVATFVPINGLAKLKPIEIIRSAKE